MDKQESNRNKGIKIYIHVGKNLPIEDNKAVFCELLFQDQKQVTQAIKDESPFWDETVRFPTNEFKGFLRINVRTEIGIIGSGEINLEYVSSVFDDWVRLRQSNNGSDGGEIRLVITDETKI